MRFVFWAACALLLASCSTAVDGDQAPYDEVSYPDRPVDMPITDRWARGDYEEEASGDGLFENVGGDPGDPGGPGGPGSPGAPSDGVDWLEQLRQQRQPLVPGESDAIEAIRAAGLVAV